MLYTRKGDKGKTKLLGMKADEAVSKSSKEIEALGVLDELNSFLGLVKIKSTSDVVNRVQECLFIIQAELAGAKKSLTEGHLKEIEKAIDEIEKELPPIKTFSIPGGTEISALFDISRTMARKAERRLVDVHEGGKIVLSPHTLAYLNRLSSLFYALARLSNHKSGITLESPSYE